jgi:hypothetical protein
VPQRFGGKLNVGYGIAFENKPFEFLRFFLLADIVNQTGKISLFRIFPVFFRKLICLVRNIERMSIPLFLKAAFREDFSHHQNHTSKQNSLIKFRFTYTIFSA